MKLKEAEKRLKQEPDNLGLRVQVAGLMREAGRSTEAVELYRSVALAYRDQRRVHQAIAVCRSILEIAPDDVRCNALLSALQGTPEPPPTESTRWSSRDDTPLPAPVPHHVADPTARNARIDLEDLDTNPAPKRPSQRTRRSTGLAEAARKITGLIAGEQDLATSLDTRPVRRLATDEQHALEQSLPTTPTERVSDEQITAQPGEDDELTTPRDRHDPDDL